MFGNDDIILCYCQRRKPDIINHHQSSSIIINHHQSSSIIINHHQSSSIIIIHRHQSSYIAIHHPSSINHPSSIINNNHPPSSIIIHNHPSSINDVSRSSHEEACHQLQIFAKISAELPRKLVPQVYTGRFGRLRYLRSPEIPKPRKGSLFVKDFWWLFKGKTKRKNKGMSFLEKRKVPNKKRWRMK